VSYVHLPPYRVTFSPTPLSEGVDWGLHAYGIPSLWKGTQGDGVTVAVVDTGIAPHYALEVKDHRNFSSDSDQHDTVGHGCIAPDDDVYTSSCGVQKISTLFDRVDGVVHLLQDGSVVKDVSRLGIHTIGYDAETQATVRRKVLAVHKLPYSGKIVSVKTREGRLRFTPWHPVYVQTSQRGGDRTVRKLRADELVVGQRLVASRESEGVYSELHHIPLLPRWQCVACGYVAGKGDRKQCRKCNKCRWHNGPTARSIALDENLAFFLGLVASDGHVMKRQKTIGFYNNNRVLADVFEELCVELFGRKPVECKQDRRSQQIIEQRLNSVDAWDVCSRQIGMPSDKSRTLEFPELVAKSRPAVVLSFLAGVVEGDGSICKRTGRIRIATGSEQFGRRIVSLCRFLGLCASMQEVKPSATGFKTDRSSWSVRLGFSPRLSSMLRVKKSPRPVSQRDRRAISVQEIGEEDYEGCMYDLTVEGSHNYAANGVIVSNTHVAGIIGAKKGPAKGIAPGCTLLSLKVLGHSGMGSNESVAQAVTYATEAKVDIICMSLGSARPDAQLHAAIKAAHSNGIVVVCAAGNDGGAVDYPAAFQETIAVGAVDRNGNACEFSSRGKEVAVAAPGQDITSTWLADGYATISGTSMAAPFVAGVLALYVSSCKREGMKVDLHSATSALAYSCRDVGEQGRDDIYGWGLLDPHKLLNYEVRSSKDGVTIWIPGAKIL
jgi:intein/homing endonuclease